jgi:hypothetical protein
MERLRKATAPCSQTSSRYVFFYKTRNQVSHPYCFTRISKSADRALHACIPVHLFLFNVFFDVMFNGIVNNASAYRDATSTGKDVYLPSLRHAGLLTGQGQQLSHFSTAKTCSVAGLEISKYNLRTNTAVCSGSSYISSVSPVIRMTRLSNTV